MENPYIVDRPLTERDLFFGREEHFDRLTAALHRGQQMILLYGRRQIGKTSFLNQLPSRYGARYQVHYGSLDTDAKGSPDLLWEVMGAISRATGRPIPDEAAYRRDPMAMALAYLRALATFEGDARHLVCLDALPEGSLVPQGPAHPAWAILRQVLPELPAWSFLIAIEGAPVKAGEDDDLAALPRIVLGPLTEDETHDALTVPVRNVLAYDYEAVNHVHRLCGGQPYFIQLFGHILFERRAAMGWVGLPEVEQATAEVVERAGAQFQALWQACSPLERVVLCALAEMPGHHGLGSAQDVLLYLHQRQAEVKLPAIEAALEELAGREILEQLGGKILRFRVGLLSIWLKRHQSLSQALRQAKVRRRAEARPIAPPEGRRRDWLGLLLWLVAAALVVSIAAVWRSRERGILWTAEPTAMPQATSASMMTATPSPTGPAGAGAGVAPGFIVYTAKERAEDTWEIYVMRSDGSDPTRLTHNAANDIQPMWSPDGRRIVFVSDRDGNREIYVMNADGNEQLNLTHHPAEDWTPCWSPDGQRIAFTSFRDGNWEIYVMNADGTNPQRLTRHTAADYSPAWSPDGQRIAFVSNRDGNLEIYLMNADGSNPSRFTHHEATDQNPAWSPDGLWLYWESGRDGNMEIYRARLDGSELTNLTRDPQANDHGPTCSPRGDKIAFFSNRDQGWDIYTLDLATGARTNLTLSAALEQMPHWGAAGRP